MFNFIFQLLDWLQSHQTPTIIPNPVPMPTEPLAPSRANLTTFCEAIKSREGFFPPCKQYPLGTPSYRNNNPGNARYNPTGYLPIYGNVGKSGNGFAIFKDYATGWLYLMNMVKYKIEQHPNETIQDFFNSYSPKSDGNDPISYAKEVATKCGVTPNFQVKGLL